MHLRSDKPKGIAVNGVPIKKAGDLFGILNIVPGRPDHVFSGINYGYNLASDLQYSATAGAAFEPLAEDAGVAGALFGTAVVAGRLGASA